jgi:hypothetical protein
MRHGAGARWHCRPLPHNTGQARPHLCDLDGSLARSHDALHAPLLRPEPLQALLCKRLDDCCELLLAVLQLAAHVAEVRGDLLPRRCGVCLDARGDYVYRCGGV